MVEPPVPNKQDHQDSDKISPWAVVRVDRSDEVARYDPGALVESMVNGDQVQNDRRHKASTKAKPGGSADRTHADRWYRAHPTQSDRWNG